MTSVATKAPPLVLCCYISIKGHCDLFVLLKSDKKREDTLSGCGHSVPRGQAQGVQPLQGVPQVDQSPGPRGAESPRERRAAELWFVAPPSHLVTSGHRWSFIAKILMFVGI